MNRPTRILLGVCVTLFGLFSMVRGFRGLFGSSSKTTEFRVEERDPFLNNDLYQQMDESRPLSERMKGPLYKTKPTQETEPAIEPAAGAKPESPAPQK